MSEKNEINETIAITLGAIGAIAIITAQAMRIVELKAEVKNKTKVNQAYKRRYEQALNMMTVEQLQNVLTDLKTDLRFENIVKNFK